MSVKCLHQQKASKGGSMSRISLKQDHELDEATLKMSKPSRPQAGMRHLLGAWRIASPSSMTTSNFTGRPEKVVLLMKL